MKIKIPRMVHKSNKVCLFIVTDCTICILVPLYRKFQSYGQVHHRPQQRVIHSISFGFAFNTNQFTILNFLYYLQFPGWVSGIFQNEILSLEFMDLWHEFEGVLGSDIEITEWMNCIIATWWCFLLCF